VCKTETQGKRDGRRTYLYACGDVQDEAGGARHHSKGGAEDEMLRRCAAKFFSVLG